jgi:hypothetical protein
MRTKMFAGALLLLALTGCSERFESKPYPPTTPQPTVVQGVDAGQQWKDCARMYWRAARDIGQAAAKENRAVMLLQQAEQAILDGDIGTATDNNNTAAGLVNAAGDLAAGQADALTGHSECAFN